MKACDALARMRSLGWLPLAGLGVLVVALSPGFSENAIGEDAPAHVSSRSEGVWRVRCGGCHLAFDPALLPGTAWRTLVGRLPEHFGARVALAQEERREVLAWLEAGAADAAVDGLGVAVMGRMARTDRPSRVTETRWFRHRHVNIPRATWSRDAVASPANCAACHREAGKGIFDERSVRVPG
ncbi:MAG: hypothetical protein KDH20_14310 [Rhodocyclaceae bacterium]|nr:hypothetical protein [Rhodocyclaceae bacterium]